MKTGERNIYWKLLASLSLYPESFSQPNLHSYQWLARKSLFRNPAKRLSYEECRVHKFLYNLELATQIQPLADSTVQEPLVQ